MRNARRIFLVSAILSVIGIGIAAFFIIRGNGASSVESTTENPEVAPFIIIPIVLIITGLAMLPFLRIMFPKQIKNAVSAPAKVIKVWDTGVSINNNPQVGLLLEIAPEGGTPFQVEANTLVSRLQTSLVAPGVCAQVRYDALDPKNLQVVSLDLSEAAPSSAEARIRELNSLRENNLITDEEYQKKRDDIIKSV